MTNKPTVLIIDDEENIRKTLALILNQKGYIADAAKNAEEALRKTSEKHYNILLIDIVLPDIGGVELLSRLGETKPKARKIIMTGNPSIQNAVEALNKGADAYIMKPLDIEKFLATLEQQSAEQRKEYAISVEQFERGRLRGRIDVLAKEGSF